MIFKSKTEAYSSAILFVTLLGKDLEAMDKTRFKSQLKIIKKCLDTMKIAMENHEQKIENFTQLMEPLINALDKPFIKTREKLLVLKKDIEESSYEQSTEEKFKNPLARRAESELALVLLQNPTTVIMNAVKRVSDALLACIEDMGAGKIDEYNFMDSVHLTGFGCFSTVPTIEQIKDILSQNKAENLIEIIAIHYKFSLFYLKRTPIKIAPERAPVGKLAEAIKPVWDKAPELFFSEGISKDTWESEALRRHIPDVWFYQSALYKAPTNRGRLGGLFGEKGHQMGLMLQKQKEFEVGMPEHSSSWLADCKHQEANLNSPYVLDLVENDAVYVAGPSGMTSLLLGQMELMVNFEQEELKQQYLAAIMTYIVGGGFHSIHEVIGPAEYALGLVPGYQIQVPEAEKLAPPPNYHQFYALIEKNDPEFKRRREEAWDRYVQFFNEHYIPKYLSDFVQPEALVEFKSEEMLQDDEKTNLVFKENEILEDLDLILLEPEEPGELNEPEDAVETLEVPCSHLSPALKREMVQKINAYIYEGLGARGKDMYDKNQLSTISFFFRNKALTEEKLGLALSFRENLQKITNREDTKKLIDETIEKNKEIEETYEKSYSLNTKSGLLACMQEMRSDLESFENEVLGYNLKNAILDEIDGYIKDDFFARGCKDAPDTLSFFSRMFRNTDLTKQKLVLANNFRTQLCVAKNLTEVQELIEKVIEKNKYCEQVAKKHYSIFTSSGLEARMRLFNTMVNRCIEQKKEWEIELPSSNPVAT